MKKHTLGIDIGSTTVKIAILDENDTLVFSDYERHFANIQETLADLLQKAEDQLGEDVYKRQVLFRFLLSVPLYLCNGICDQIAHLFGSDKLASVRHDISCSVTLCKNLLYCCFHSICFFIKIQRISQHHSSGKNGCCLLYTSVSFLLPLITRKRYSGILFSGSITA